MLRIIAGEFRSRRLLAPEGTATRPTLDSTRESLFNILQGSVQGSAVLDLFAGSGALCLEALSRGAAYGVVVDSSREAAQCLRQNIEALGLEDRSRVMQMDWARAVDALAAEQRAFDLIFLDPPYGFNLEPVLEAIARHRLLRPDGILIAEHSRRTPLPMPPGLAPFRQKDYRDTRIDLIGWLEEQHEDSGIPGQL